MKFLKVSGYAFLSLLVLLVTALFLIPQPDKPAPTGVHTVGVTEFEVTEGNKWVVVTAWYPAQPSVSRHFLPYMAAYIAEAISEKQKIPASWLKDERPSFAHIDAEVFFGRHRVLLFNHGFSSHAYQNLTQMEELASHGYIVLSLSHPGHSVVTKRQNGDLVFQSIPLEPEYAPQRIAAMDRAAVSMRSSSTINDWIDATSPLEEGLFRNIPAYVDEWSENNRRVIRALTRVNLGAIPTPLKGHLDTESVGVFGHSFGGSVAADLAFSEPNIKAAMSLDSYVYTHSLQDTMKVPLCVAYGDVAESPSDESMAWINQTLFETKAVSGSCEVLFVGAAHLNFSDLNHLPVGELLGLTGSIDADVMHQSSNQLLLSYFGHHLKGTPQVNDIEGVQMVVY
ncbi:alpha/beta hydrolase family protein [Enterovibrio norvegicus]|uniref:alpha/beta hydrolase family protein n=1 Tax=Enterovibrio norvegicus TaxID=188144 RepID=UPI00352C488A